MDEKGLSASTVDTVHSVLHQLFAIAVDDNYIRTNPSDNALCELKKARHFETEKRSALTEEQEKIFLGFLQGHPVYGHWYPVFAVMVNSGLRVGEATGLRWQDIDLDAGIIDVNHTLVYYAHRIVRPGEKTGCYYAINSTKTPASKRQIPMLDVVKEAFIAERARQEAEGVHCKSTVDGYKDFIFVNRFGSVQHQGTLNKALHRIIRDCNAQRVELGCNVLLPRFSCHSLRHTFATRMCEKGVNIKVMQDVMGHADISTTLNIYTDATSDMKTRAFQDLNRCYKG